MLRRLIIPILTICTFTVCAQASIIPYLASGPVDLGGGLYDFYYNVSLSGDERLDPSATNGDSCFGGPCDPAGTFFTIYDIVGLNGAASPADWGVNIQTNGLTPFNAPIPDSSLYNVTFTYIGPVVTGPLDITGFQIISTVNSIANGKFSSQSTNNTSDLSGTTDFVFGSVSVPASAVPEPSFSAVLLGGGLIAFGFVRRRLRR
jgi:hypothetical protein